jgi:hypothetical protein
MAHVVKLKTKKMRRTSRHDSDDSSTRASTPEHAGAKQSGAGKSSKSAQRRGSADLGPSLMSRVASTPALAASSGGGQRPATLLNSKPRIALPSGAQFRSSPNLLAGYQRTHISCCCSFSLQ